jgi:outer membrane protein assembly factor BamB
MTFGTFGLRLFSALVAVVLFVTLSDAANWARFRGPNGTGVADDKDIPIKWTDKDIAWKVEIPGTGHSSPIVWSDRIFLQSASNDGKERMILCLNTADGKTVWQKTLDAKKASTHKNSSMASSTPATDGERVYAYSWDGTSVALYAFDFKTGEQVWKYDLGAYDNEHGAGASPMLAGGKVVVMNDHAKGASVVAVDAKSGKKAWEAKREPYRACYATPFVRTVGQKAELVVASTTEITGYDVGDGSKNWHHNLKFDGMPLRVVASPVLAGEDLVVIHCGDGKGDRNTTMIRLPGKAGAEPTTVWEQKQSQKMPYVPCSLSRGENLYWVNDSGFAGCTVAATGEILFEERLPGAKNVTASPVMIDGKIYAPDEGGIVHVFAAEPKFRELAKNSLGEGVMASPAVADGKLYIRGKTHLFCIGKK